MIELEQAATHLRRALGEDLNMALSLMGRLSAAMQRHFDDPTFLQVAIKEQA